MFEVSNPRQSRNTVVGIGNQLCRVRTADRSHACMPGKHVSKYVMWSADPTVKTTGICRRTGNYSPAVADDIQHRVSQNLKSGSVFWMHGIGYAGK